MAAHVVALWLLLLLWEGVTCFFRINRQKETGPENNQLSDGV